MRLGGGGRRGRARIPNVTSFSHERAFSRSCEIIGRMRQRRFLPLISVTLPPICRLFEICLSPKDSNAWLFPSLPTYHTRCLFHLGYNVHTQLLSIKILYCLSFPPQFESTVGSHLTPKVNQRLPHEISNCGGKLV